MKGREIRLRREARGWSLEQLAHEASYIIRKDFGIDSSVSWTTIQRIETGRTKKPQALTLAAIEKALGHADPVDMCASCEKLEDVVEFALGAVQSLEAGLVILDERCKDAAVIRQVSLEIEAATTDLRAIVETCGVNVDD